jgi:hypothetical protein
VGYPVKLASPLVAAGDDGIVTSLLRFCGDSFEADSEAPLALITVDLSVTLFKVLLAAC